MSRRSFRFTRLWLLCLPFCGPGTCPAEESSAQTLPPGVEIAAAAEPIKATVGDPIRIELRLELPEGYQPRFPPLSGQAGEFVILENRLEPPAQGIPPKTGGSKPDKAQEPAGRFRPHLMVAAYKPGTFDFPPLKFELLETSGKRIPVSTPAVRIQIESVLSEKDPGLKELKRQAEIAEPVRWLLWLALGFLGLIAAGVAWWLWSRRKRPLKPAASRQLPDPLQLAEAELRELLGRGYIENGLVKQFYVILSEIARKILEAGFGIQTLEKTTAEIMSELRAVDSCPGTAAELERIEFLLMICDMVKFAKYTPPGPENEGAVRNVFEILASCRKRRAPLPAPPSIRPEGVA